MNNFLRRLILTITSVPLLFFFIFWPMNSHIFLIIVFGFIATFLGSYEIAHLMNKKNIDLNRMILPAINTFIFIFAYFYANNLFNIQNFKQVWIIFALALFIYFSFIYASDVFKKDLKFSFEKMSYAIFGVIYIGIPSFFIPFLLNVDFRPINPVPIFCCVESHGTLTGSLLALFFIIITFANDIFCYVFGITLGKNNIIGLVSSPKKSWAGYIGGFISTVFFSLMFYLIFDKLYNLINFPLWFYLALSFLSSILVPIGDLVESVIKRSTSVKDSGNLILGRGGVLDSVDSILYFMPIYFIFLQLYFSFK